MVKHNNQLPHVHFHKWWQRHVRTWFNQPGRKNTRRLARQKKIAKVSPRPTQLLRPVVRAPTQLYNIKQKLGKGFTLAELKKANLTKKTAKMIGIAVDHRRTNHSMDSLDANYSRLKTYMQKLVVFPKKVHNKKGFGGIPNDTPKSELQTLSHITYGKILPIKKHSYKIKSKALTESDKNFNAYATLRKSLRDSKNIGKHQKKDDGVVI